MIITHNVNAVAKNIDQYIRPRNTAKRKNARLNVTGLGSGGIIKRILCVLMPLDEGDIKTERRCSNISIYMKWRYNLKNDNDIWERIFIDFEEFAEFIINNNKNITILVLQDHTNTLAKN